MRSIFILLSLVLVANMAPAATISPVEPATQPGDLVTDSEIDAAIARMNDPEAHIADFGRLLKYSSRYAVEIGSMIDGTMYAYLEKHPEIKPRLARVNAALAKVKIDIQVVKAGFADPSMVDWALGAVEELRIRDETGAVVHSPELLALMPTVRKYAVCDNERTRGIAEQALEYFPTEQDFAASLADKEKSPENIMRIVNRNSADSYFQHMNAQLVRLLHDDDVKVRSRALGFIAFNSSMAPMLQCKFDTAVIRRVEQLCDSSADRAAAGGTLGSIVGLDTANAVPILEKLGREKDPAVRLQVAMGIVDDGTNARIHQLQLTLLDDRDDEVKYFAILGLGRADHVPELKELSKSKSREVAAFATGSLKRIEQDQQHR